MELQKEKFLEELNKEIKSCKKCLLWKTRKNAVPGEGSAYAKIIVIGQAPGVNEDLTGRPFCGKAGKLLDKLLKIARLERKEIFITSPLKCFPPGNRKPKKEEIEACLPYLKKQIEIINPKYFILLGEVALKVFFPQKKLKDFRGRAIEEGEKFYFPTYHPAAGLRFPKMKEILEKDFRKLARFLDFQKKSGKI